MRRSSLIVAFLLVGLLAAPAGHAQVLKLPARDEVRLAEAVRLAAGLRGRLWPAWDRTAMPVLLIVDSTEFLLGHPRPGAGFTRAGHHASLNPEVWSRRRQFPPNLLATFPVGGAPTIVIGSAERTGKSSVAWVLTILHEHFHQWQYSQPDYYAGVARLDLARGDTTGQWMLEYPFPYDAAPVGQAMHRLASALARALDEPSTSAKALGEVIAARDSLRRHISEDDYKYFEFQLWQEGVARFIEYAAGAAASALGEPSAEFRRLPDYEAYSEAAARARRALRVELSQLNLARQRRIAFYSVGAAIALLLDASRPDWKRLYAERPFELAALLSRQRRAP